MNKIITNEKYLEVFNKLKDQIKKDKRINADNTLIIAVDLYNCSYLAQLLSHSICSNGRNAEILYVEIPRYNENDMVYKIKFEEVFKQYANDYNNFLILTNDFYNNILGVLNPGIEIVKMENIFLATLFCNELFKGIFQFVGEIYESNVKLKMPYQKCI